MLRPDVNIKPRKKGQKDMVLIHYNNAYEARDLTYNCICLCQFLVLLDVFFLFVCCCCHPPHDPILNLETKNSPCRILKLN